MHGVQKRIFDIPNQLDKGEKTVHFPVQNKIIVVTSDFKGIYLSASDRGVLSRLQATDPGLESDLADSWD